MLNPNYINVLKQQPMMQMVQQPMMQQVAPQMMPNMVPVGMPVMMQQMPQYSQGVNPMMNMIGQQMQGQIRNQFVGTQPQDQQQVNYNY
jgi:hypothetical protein